MSNQSEHINELAKALSKAQGQMRSAVKDSANPFFKSKFADLTSVWQACQEPLTSNGLCVMQTVEGEKDNMILVTTLAHESGQWIKSRLPIVVQKNDPQGVGSGLSYSRRYALSAICGVTADDDDGEKAMDRVNASQVAELETLLKSCDQSFQKEMMGKLASVGVKALRELTKPVYDRTMVLTNEHLKVMQERKGASQ